MASVHVPLWRRLWTVGWLILLAIAAVVANIYYTKDNFAKQNAGNSLCDPNGLCVDSAGNPVINGFNTTFSDGLICNVRFAGIDTTALKISYRLTVWGLGKYATLKNISLVGGDTTAKFTGTTAVSGIDVVTTANVDASFQPVDQYSAAFLIAAFEGNTTQMGARIPIAFIYQGGKGAWFVQNGIIEADVAPNYSYGLSIIVRRSGTIKFISILSAIVQGATTLLYLTITTATKKVPAPLVALGVGLLFGLPNLPGSPSTMVVLTLVFIGACTVFNMFRFVYEIQPLAKKAN
ncbi:hypothetical protein M427DRAFT_48067 [Gonapodya prolifera JEL478]|uniref:Uncharacterized protein n=1 Tax=Gonapodya prolifera (strain JEL478) TaxID=1344416 RepID=A0A139A158_GONPJ|nr:hypothetical protein M427DRAFT_48067 [Gonapodya prolifera JEL478]|eukprot:KXS10464.1 hypothetical protein M427DRAFT_48067 [Gonapodya prolifera JEL478]